MALAFIQNLGPWQIIICIVVAFLLIGSKKIPELARSLGKAKNEFKKGLAEGAAEGAAEAKKDEAAKEPEKIPQAR